MGGGPGSFPTEGFELERATDAEVAAAVPGLHLMTISKRERGVVAVGGEAEYALRYLVEHPELLSHPTMDGPGAGG